MKPGIYWSEVSENYVIYGCLWYSESSYVHFKDDRVFTFGINTGDFIDVCRERRPLAFKALQLDWICEL